MITLQPLQIAEVVKKLHDHYTFKPKHFSNPWDMPTEFYSSGNVVDLRIEYIKQLTDRITGLSDFSNCINSIHLWANSPNFQVDVRYSVRNNVVVPLMDGPKDKFVTVSAVPHKTGIELATKGAYLRNQFVVRKGQNLRTLEVLPGFDYKKPYALDSRLLTPQFGGANLIDPVQATSWLMQIHDRADHYRNVAVKAEDSLRPIPGEK